MKTNNRSYQPELLDLGPSAYTDKEYEDCLYQLARIGEILGGDKATIKTIMRHPVPKSILDVGCGGGQFTLKLAGQFPKAQVLGIDLSSQAIAFSKQRLSETPLKNVHFEVPLTPELSYKRNSFDIVTSTLVCHHMNDAQLVDFLKRSYEIAAKYVIINDLHRHWLASKGFALLAKPLFANRLIEHDGLLSIKRAFKKRDWIHYLQAAEIPLGACSISWHWAFRWVVCIDTSFKLS